MPMHLIYTLAMLENLASQFTQDNNDPSEYIANGSYIQLEFFNVTAASVESIV